MKRSQKAAEKLLDVKEHQILGFQAQIESCTGSLPMAEKMTELNSKEMLGLRAALAFNGSVEKRSSESGPRFTRQKTQTNQNFAVGGRAPQKVPQEKKKCRQGYSGCFSFEA